MREESIATAIVQVSKLAIVKVWSFGLEDSSVQATLGSMRGVSIATADVQVIGVWGRTM